MAEVISITHNGVLQKTVAVLDERSFVDLIVEYMGYDARDYFEDLLRGYKNAEKEREDATAEFERAADGYLGELHNIADGLYQELKRPKLNRKNLECIYKELMCSL